MGRIRQAIQVRGRDCWTLFDSGVRNSYIVPAVAALVPTSKIDQPFRSRLGGSIKESKELALLEVEVEGRRISTNAMVIDDIGTDEAGTPIEPIYFVRSDTPDDVFVSCSTSAREGHRSTTKRLC